MPTDSDDQVRGWDGEGGRGVHTMPPAITDNCSILDTCLHQLQHMVGWVLGACGWVVGVGGFNLTVSDFFAVAQPKG